MATLLITNLITGTSAGDTLSKIGASKSNLGLKTPLIRGKLNLSRQANPELAEGNISLRASVETFTRRAPLGQRESPLLYESRGLVYPKYCADRSCLWCSDRDPAEVPCLI